MLLETRKLHLAFTLACGNISLSCCRMVKHLLEEERPFQMETLRHLMSACQ